MRHSIVNSLFALAGLLTTLLVPVRPTAAQQRIVQARGVDQQVRYETLTRFGPWDDRNYELTRADLDLLAPNEEELVEPLPAFFRVALRRLHPQLPREGPAQYPRSALQIFLQTYGGYLIDGRLYQRIDVQDGRFVVMTEEEEVGPQGRSQARFLDGEVRVTSPVGAAESAIKVHPLDADFVIAGSNGPGGGQRMHYSSDGGDTWTETTLPLGSTCCDPTVDWSADGSFAHAATLGNCSVATLCSVWYYRSSDGGHTWTDLESETPGDPRRELTSSGSDKEFLHVDKHPTSPYVDNVYLTWHDYNTLQFARSIDNGNTWTTTSFTTDPQGLGSDLTTDVNGHIYYFWPATNEGEIVMKRSIDGGASFIAGTTTVSTTNAQFDFPIPSIETRRAWIYVAAAADLTDGPFSGNVYAAWTDTTGPESVVAANNHARIQVARSTDGGASWHVTTPHPTTDSNTVDRWNPWLAVGPDGTVHVIFYDTRHSAGRTGVDLYHSFSVDGAVTFSVPERLTGATSPNLGDPFEFGDYNGLDAVANRFISVFTDSRSEGGGTTDSKDIYATAGVVDRTPADVMLALDISGSMNLPACPTCDPKLKVLKESVEIFANVYAALALSGDRLGVAYFETGASEFTFGGDVLLPVTVRASDIIGDINSKTTDSLKLTNMGGGLQLAINRLSDAGRSRSIILFTDGMQNKNPAVNEVDDSPPPGAFHLEIANRTGWSGHPSISPTVPPTQLDTALDRRVHTIGVGSTPSFATLLQKIAEETGGSHRLTVAPDDVLRRFFIEELVEVLRGFSPQLVGYRYGRLADGVGTESFRINRSAKRLVLKLSWQQGEAMSFKVFKNGVDVTRLGRTTRGAFYHIYSIDLPASGLGETWPAAEWEMRISGQDTAPYEAAAISEEGLLEYEVSVGDGTYRVGEPLDLGVSLLIDGVPLAGADKVVATVLAPKVGTGTLLSTTATPSFSSLAAEEAATGAQKKLAVLLQDPKFFNSLLGDARSVTLTDNGNGTYSGQFDDTEVPGIYHVTFEIEGDEPRVGFYRRSETLSAVVEVGVLDFSASSVELDWPRRPSDQKPIVLTLSPRDTAGNYLGPDYQDHIQVLFPEKSGSQGKVVDRLDGSYAITLNVSPDADPRAVINVLGQPLFDGQLSELSNKFAFSAHLGVTEPQGTFGRLFDGNDLYELDLEYRLTRHLYLNAVVGNYTFDPSYDLLGGTLYLRRYWPRTGFRLFVEAGPGLYDPDNLSSAFGVSAGSGVDRPLAGRWRGEIGADYFRIFNSGDDIEFLAFKLGLRRTF